MQPFKPITPLPKIQAPTAAEVCAKFKPSPGAQALLKPGQTPAEYVHVLEQNKQPVDAVNTLAHGMPERESVWYACQSSQKVAGKLNTADKSALTAAQTWVKNPTPATKAAASAAAAQTDHTGPGAWAAQAAAWSKTPDAATPVSAATPSLAAPAAAGSVLLAAGLVDKPAMPEVPKPKLEMPAAQAPALETPALKAPAVETPAITQPQIPTAEQAKFNETLQPFVGLGKDVASGKNSWA